MMTSITEEESLSRASSPSPAVSIAYPSEETLAERLWRSSGSSSTIRTRAAAGVWTIRSILPDQGSFPPGPGRYWGSQRKRAFAHKKTRIADCDPGKRIKWQNKDFTDAWEIRV